MPFSDEFKDNNAAQKSALMLAFIGDAVFERFVREIAVTRIPGAKVRKLHIVCSAAVNCRSQAEILTRIESSLDETERGVVHRGMNSKPHSVPKNANIDDYLKATGFEALLGYLELSGQKGRLFKLLDQCKETVESFIDGANK